MFELCNAVEWINWQCKMLSTSLLLFPFIFFFLPNFYPKSIPSINATYIQTHIVFFHKERPLYAHTGFHFTTLYKINIHFWVHFDEDVHSMHMIYNQLKFCDNRIYFSMHLNALFGFVLNLYLNKIDALNAYLFVFCSNFYLILDPFPNTQANSICFLSFL